MTTLSLRALNRATLDRQLLLRRHPLTARQAVRHLAGLQGQAPLAPYVGLWTRLSGFTPDGLSQLLTARTVVRAAVMRGTVHVVDAADFAVFRPLRRLDERDHANIVSWNEYQTGSHWATQDAPGPLAGDIRGFFRKLRT